jgi:hypothetical protein
VLLAALSACTGSSGEQEGAERPDPEDALASVEERLMEARASRIDFRVTASGAATVELEGRLVLGDSGRVRLEGTGALDGEEVSLLLVSDGRTMRATNGVDTVEAAAPAALKEALVVGFARMGVLHHLVRLADATAPAHAEGGVHSWVRTVDVRREERGSLAFDIQVDGEPSGTAVLFMSPGTELPGERRQTVASPDGELIVTELYGAMSVGGGAEPADFVLD